MCLYTSSALSVEQVKMLKRDGQQNEIPLLKNRFRVDSNVDEITLLIFRRVGSRPVVLVRPDGVKYSVADLATERVAAWYDEPGFDIVSIKKPMAGPWQAIGDVLPNSRIVVLGDIELKTTPLPPLLFRGEIIKVTGQILNDGDPIDANLFEDVVNLNLYFVSANTGSLANFGAGRQSAAEFKDNGYGLDERAKDGIFTGEFSFSFPAGEWIPELDIITPLFERRVVQESILINEPPFSYTIKAISDDKAEHELTINIDNQVVKPETILFQGKIYYPNNEEQTFTLDATAQLTRHLMIKNNGWGRYNIELSAFGTNINGREFMATLPTYNFSIEKPQPVATEIAVAPDIVIEEPVTTDDIIETMPVEEKMTTLTLISLVIGCNIFILLIGWVVIRIFVQKKPLNLKIDLSFLKKKKADHDENINLEKTKTTQSGSKSDKTDEILDLSMSDD